MAYDSDVPLAANQIAADLLAMNLNWENLAPVTIAVTNTSTTHAGKIFQNEVLAAGKYAFWVYSNSIQVNSPLVRFEQEHASSDQDCVVVLNDGTGRTLHLENTNVSDCLFVDQQGVQAASKYGLYVYSNAIQVNSPLVRFQQSHASSDQAVLQTYQGGTGVQIIGTGNENLSNAGVWTDRSSTYEMKDNIAKLPVVGYADKLKNMDLFRFQKIDETKFLAEKAPYHIGYILDDKSTPDELISFNVKGELDPQAGLAAQKGIAFLLAVNKELVERLETVEQKVAA